MNIIRSVPIQELRALAEAEKVTHNRTFGGEGGGGAGTLDPTAGVLKLWEGGC